MVFFFRPFVPSNKKSRRPATGKAATTRDDGNREATACLPSSVDNLVTGMTAAEHPRVEFVMTAKTRMTAMAADTDPTKGGGGEEGKGEGSKRRRATAARKSPVAAKATGRSSR